MELLTKKELKEIENILDKGITCGPHPEWTKEYILKDWIPYLVEENKLLRKFILVHLLNKVILEPRK